MDGFHKSSEIQNYLTRYLATTKDRIAVLITFSAHTLYYSKYSQDFLARDRLPPGHRPEIPQSCGWRGRSRWLTDPFGVSQNPDLAGGDLPPEEQAGHGGGGGGFGNKTKSVLALAIILAAIGAYLMLKRGKKKF